MSTSKKITRHFSFAFLLAIPSNYILGSLLGLALLDIWEQKPFEKEVWALFSIGVVSAFCFIGSSKIYTFRTFIHELKHFVVVVMTGNKVKDFHVDTHTGHVKFEMYKDKVHFAPIISLAPYFLPLFSFPVFIACLISEDYYRLPLIAALGVSLGIDLQFGYKEIHPHQTDLTRIRGGYFSSGIYLVGVHFLWITCCLLWVIDGRQGFFHAGELVWELVNHWYGEN